MGVIIDFFGGTHNNLQDYSLIGIDGAARQRREEVAGSSYAKI